MRFLLSLFLLTTLVHAQWPPTAVYQPPVAGPMSFVTSDEPDTNLFDLSPLSRETFVFHHNNPTGSSTAHEFHGRIKFTNQTAEDLYIHHPDGTITGPVAPGNFIFVPIADQATPLELEPDESAEYEVKDEFNNEEGSFTINGSNRASTAAAPGGQSGIINLPADAERAQGT